jgi:antitoxin FitA
VASLTIRALDDRVKADLRLRAARNGRSMEAEARAILEAAVAGEPRAGLGTRLRERFRGTETALELPSRTDPGRPPPDFAERTDVDE